MSFQTFVSSPARPRVSDCVEVIKRNVQTKKTTTIVLPPRYGKSNVIRLSSIELIQSNIAGCAIAMAPWTMLRDQLVDDDTMSRMVLDYNFSGAPRAPDRITADILSGRIDPKFYEDKPPRLFWAMTMGQASQPATMEVLKGAAQHFRMLGRPMVVFIDEGHTVASDSEGWGEIARVLSSHGAHIVLLTGTPERADNTAPFGFETEEMSRDCYEYKVSKSFDEDFNLRQTVRADRVEYRLKADVNVTLREAWEQGIICNIQPRFFTFKVDGQEVSSESLSKAEARRALAIAVREKQVIREAVRLMINDVRVRRSANDFTRSSAAMIFTGNDEAEDGKDFHAREVRRIVRDEWQAAFGTEPVVYIATLDEKGDGKKAQELIERFVGRYRNLDTKKVEPATGDVLIVKQMGGVGLDGPRIKTLVDLSTVRTKANATQRWLRVATEWRNKNYRVNHGTIIIPDDANTVGLYDDIVKENGGQSLTENQVVIDEQLVEKGETEPRDEPVISDARRNGATDSSLLKIDAERDVLIDTVLMQHPFLVDRLTRVEIARLMVDGLIQVTAPADASQVPQSVVRNLATEIKDCRDNCNETAKKIVNKTVRYEGPGSTQYGEEISRVMGMAKIEAGIVGALDKCRDIEKLKKLEQILDRALRKGVVA